MTPTQLTNRIDALVEDSSAKFLTQVAKDQEKLLQEIKALIRELEVKNGLLTKTTKNLRTIRKLDQKMRKSLDESGYSKRVADFNENYGIVSELQNEYFAGLTAAFTPNESFLKAVTENAITMTEESLLGAGLDKELIEPVRKILQENIMSGASITDLEKQISDFIVGNPEKLGRLQGYSGQIVRDSLNQFSRSYHEGISEDLKVEWFIFSGGTVKDTRDFCREHEGNYYPRSEIEKWPSRNWQGKIPGTTKSSIYIYLGGYNCMHRLLAVDSRVVPDSVKRIFE